MRRDVLDALTLLEDNGYFGFFHKSTIQDEYERLLEVGYEKISDDGLTDTILNKIINEIENTKYEHGVSTEAFIFYLIEYPDTAVLKPVEVTTS